MQIPTFPECDHDLVKALIHHSDYELVNKLQRSPMEGKYFITLFCRYSPVVYSLIRHSAKSPVQADYLFAITWRHILNELTGIDLTPFQPGKGVEFSLQGWLINLTATHINQAIMPEVEAIHYTLRDAPPPLWCYTERALDNMQPKHRLIVLMAQTFKWSSTRISAYLQAEGDHTSPQAVESELQVAYQALEKAIPEDVREIYLNHPPAIVHPPGQRIIDAQASDVSSTSASSPEGNMTIEFN